LAALAAAPLTIYTLEDAERAVSQGFHKDAAAAMDNVDLAAVHLAAVVMQAHDIQSAPDKDDWDTEALPEEATTL
jgi:hypothetical protein